MPNSPIAHQIPPRTLNAAMFRTVTPTALARRMPSRSMNAMLTAKKPTPPGVVRPVNATAIWTAVVFQNGSGAGLDPSIDTADPTTASIPVRAATASHHGSAARSEPTTPGHARQLRQQGVHGGPEQQQADEGGRAERRTQGGDGPVDPLGERLAQLGDREALGGELPADPAGQGERLQERQRRLEPVGVQDPARAVDRALHADQ